MFIQSLDSITSPLSITIGIIRIRPALKKIFHRVILSVSIISFSNSILATERTIPLSSIDSPPKVLRKANDYQFDWDKMETEEKKQQEEWSKQQVPFAKYTTNGPIAPVIAAMETLGLDERPLAFGQKSYIEDPMGKTVFAHYKDDACAFRVKDFGRSPTRVAYVAGDGDEHRETFTPALAKGRTYKHGRKHPFTAFSLRIKGELIHFDAGHGIDQADTVVANGRNSSTDADNFVPQNRYYNQYIRNPMVNYVVRNGGGGSYKEISVYDMDSPLIHTLSNKNKCHIPIGFIFVIFNNHEVARTFYFPNLISYEKLAAQQNIGEYYKNFMNYFEISKEEVANKAVRIGDTDRHTRAVNDHADKGYRALSGRHDVVGHIQMPNPAKAALRRLLAIYNMEQAAHLEYRCVEQKAQLVDTFTSQMKYYALDKATEEEDEKRKEAYWKAITDEEQRLAQGQDNPTRPINLLEYALSMNNLTRRLHGEIPADDPMELALKRVQKRQKELEAGQSLYNPERAKVWLARIEESVRQTPQIEDLIRLLNLHDIPEIRNPKKKHFFEELLEEVGKSVNLEEQKYIGDYFAEQLENEDRAADVETLQQKVVHWQAIVEQGIEKSDSIEDITKAAEWYHGGRGMFSQNTHKARILYQTLFPVVGKSEQERIKYCLESLNKREAYLLKHVSR